MASETATGAGVVFQEALDYFRQKVNLPTQAWTDLWEGMHARAFVVAGATKAELLADFRAAIEKAIAKGTTLAEFRKDFDRIVASHGWSYKGGRGWRSAVIYNTNLRMARAAGRWAQILRLKDVRPYLRYSAVMDGRTRPQHRAWHGTILRWDDAWWQTHYPPNGWNCRCNVEQLSAADLQRHGWKTTRRPPPVAWEERTLSGGGTVKVPAGIDPGFAYNVGRADKGDPLQDQVMDRWRRQGAKAWEVLTPGDWKSWGRPEVVPIDEATAKPGPPTEDATALHRAIAAAIGGDRAVLVLPDGTRFEINARSLAGHVAPNRGPYIPFLPETAADPFEIWMAFERHRGTGRIELRVRALKRIGTAKGNQTLVLQAVKGRLEAWTFIPSDKHRDLRRWRLGRLIWGRQ